MFDETYYLIYLIHKVSDLGKNSGQKSDFLNINNTGPQKKKTVGSGMETIRFFCIFSR